MAFKRSAVRSRLSPPKTIDFIWNRWFFYIFQPVLCWAFLPWTTNGQQTFSISAFLLWEGRSYGICQRRNNHAGLPFPGSPAFFYSRYFFSFFMRSMASCREASQRAKWRRMRGFTGSAKKLEPDTAATPTSPTIHSQNCRSVQPENFSFARKAEIYACRPYGLSSFYV